MASQSSKLFKALIEFKLFNIGLLQTLLQVVLAYVDPKEATIGR